MRKKFEELAARAAESGEIAHAVTLLTKGYENGGSAHLLDQAYTLLLSGDVSRRMLKKAAEALGGHNRGRFWKIAEPAVSLTIRMILFRNLKPFWPVARDLLASPPLHFCCWRKSVWLKVFPQKKS